MAETFADFRRKIYPVSLFSFFFFFCECEWNKEDRRSEENYSGMRKGDENSNRELGSHQRERQWGLGEFPTTMATWYLVTSTSYERRRGREPREFLFSYDLLLTFTPEPRRRFTLGNNTVAHGTRVDHCTKNSPLVSFTVMTGLFVISPLFNFVSKKKKPRRYGRNCIHFVVVCCFIL